MDIRGYYLSGVQYVISIVSEINGLLFTLDPGNLGLHRFPYKYIDENLNELMSNNTRFSTAKRPTDSTKREYSKLKSDIYDDINTCVRTLEEM